MTVLGLLTLVAAGGLLLRAAGLWRMAGEQHSSKLPVVASFYPLADFARNVGGDLIDVTVITPAGAEPHDYEPTPRDIGAIYDAKLFIFNGNGIDAWAEKIRPDLETHGVTVLRMADYLKSRNSTEPDAASGAYDPHFWLDPVYAADEADRIGTSLTIIDASHAIQYAQQRDLFKKRLEELDHAYQTGLAQCQSRQIVTSHNAFSYLAARYHLTTRYILGLSPDEEPSPKTIADVAKIAKEKNIKIIFFETLVSPKLARTIAEEIGAQALPLNPIEGLTHTDILAGKDYIAVMQENLASLKLALSCR